MSDHDTGAPPAPPENLPSHIAQWLDSFKAEMFPPYPLNHRIRVVRAAIHQVARKRRDLIYAVHYNTDTNDDAISLLDLTGYLQVMERHIQKEASHGHD